MFLVVAALAGVAWTLSSTELWVAGQRAMPDWARGRMNATIIMVSQAATALGSLVWGPQPLPPEYSRISGGSRTRDSGYDHRPPRLSPIDRLHNRSES